MTVCLYSCLGYPVCKLHLFCAVLYRLFGLSGLHQIFQHYHINGRIFIKKITEHKICILPSSTFFSLTFLTLRRIQQCTIINIDLSVRNHTLFLSDLNEICVFSADFQNALEYQFSLKTVQWEPSCSLRTDKLSVRRKRKCDESEDRFSQFWEHVSKVI